MVLPISGPFVKTPGIPFGDMLQRGYKQAKPVDRPLEYKFYAYFGQLHGSTLYSSPGGTTGTSYGPLKSASFGPKSFPDYAYRLAAARNRAYEKLKGGLAPSAGWAENIAQAGKTREMIVSAATTLGEVASSIRRGRFDRAAMAVGLMREPKGVSKRKTAAQNFLAYEYGVKPLMKDIQESWELLCSPVDDMPLRGTGKETLRLVNWQREDQPNGSSSRLDEFWKGTVGVRYGATARIHNPNTFLANQLGLIDFALPWKLIPFSFIVDWFVNVEQCISSVSDWYGVALLHPYASVFADCSQSRVSITTLVSGANITITKDFTYRWGVELDRTLGIPGPTLLAKPFKGFSMNRGAQAIALVLSVFGK